MDVSVGTFDVRRCVGRSGCAVGVDAGAGDMAGRANVVRVVVGEPAGSDHSYATTEVVLEANVDDLDPRVWPSVLAALIAEGANDAWLSPILMKKGRPAHTLHVLASIERVDALQRVMIAHTSTISVRRIKVGKYALARRLIPVDIPGGAVQIKVAFQHDVEFEDAQEIATRSGTPVQNVLELAEAAAARAGLVRGGSLPYVAD